MGNRGRKNPIYHHKNFADYRNKVMQKELDKESPVWPDWLEDAFLDGMYIPGSMPTVKEGHVLILYRSPSSDSTTGSKEVQFKDDLVRPEHAHYGVSLDLSLDAPPTQERGANPIGKIERKDAG
jgi:hypothetical protein